MTNKTTRSYIDQDGSNVEVTKEHLDIAVELKIQLQKSSPSLKCNWKQHKKLMEEEGYEDSSSSESYRVLIKDYQRQVGLLNPLSKHVDLVADSKLKSLNRILGDLWSEKREIQLSLKEVNEFRRDFHLSKVVAEEIIEVFKGFAFKGLSDVVKLPKLKTSDNKAIIVLTDLHVGARIDNIYGNDYNYEIAQKRLNLYLEKVLAHCYRFNIKEVQLVGLGDFIEHLYMRAKQSKEAEFGLAQQILKASELIVEFMVKLSKQVNVEYTSIAGNHDRLQGDKDINFDDDNANVIINYNIKTAIQFIDSPRLTFTDTEDGAVEINKEINGKKIKLVHGHLDSKGSKTERMKSLISMQNEFFDCLVYGHLHNYNAVDADNGRMVVGVGCLSGRNDYSRTLSCATNASQMMLVVTGDGELLPIKIDLQVN